jgi:hydrogenase maturation protease
LSTNKPVLVLGVGNLLLRDEGLGVHVARRLMDMDLPLHVEVIDGGTAGLDLLEHIEGRKKVVLVDVVRGGHPPGTIYRMTPEDMEDEPRSCLSLHDINVPDLLKVADMLGVEKPEIVMIGIEPKDMDSADLELSPEIEAQVPKLIEVVMKEIQS